MTDTTETPSSISTANENFVLDHVASISSQLLRVSHDLHAHPEIRFEEVHAADLLTGELADLGFTVERGIGGLPTAFLASHGSTDDGPTIAYFLEYDALEEIGHACGHNVIASMGLGAAATVKAWMEAGGDAVGRLVVVGSPGEEGGGGKNYLITGGCLDGIDAAMMMHPAGENLSSMTTLGRIALTFEFAGRAAHAAVTPFDGINALDAAVLTLNAIGLLRQQLPSEVRVHAIVVEGGDAPNVIPERAVIRAYVRSPDTASLIEDLRPRVENCARGAALATGCTVTVSQQGPTYAALRPNPVLAALIEDGFARVGRTTEPPRSEVFPGSTDMGNVSQVIPSIHPNIEFVPGLGMHTREAASLAASDVGDRAVVDGAAVMALAGVRLFTEPGLLDRVHDAFVPGVRVE